MASESLPLLISVVAVLVSGLALGWNIYRDVILKAKVKVALKVVDLYNNPLGGTGKYIELSATNFGPGRVKIMNISLMIAPLKCRILQTQRYAVLNPDWENPLSGKIPSWIEAGDSLNMLFPFDKDCFLKENFTHVGFYDYFGRAHYAPSDHVAEAKRIWKEKFDVEN